jgi:hypothetical protein
MLPYRQRTPAATRIWSSANKPRPFQPTVPSRPIRLSVTASSMRSSSPVWNASGRPRYSNRLSSDRGERNTATTSRNLSDVLAMVGSQRRSRHAQRRLTDCIRMDRQGWEACQPKVARQLSDAGQWSRNAAFGLLNGDGRGHQGFVPQCTMRCSSRLLSLIYGESDLI